MFCHSCNVLFICIWHLNKSTFSCRSQFKHDHPILDTRISVRLVTCVSRSGYQPLDSETGWTGELWSKTNLINWQTKGSLFYWRKKLKSNFSDFFNFWNFRLLTFFFRVSNFFWVLLIFGFFSLAFLFFKEMVQLKKILVFTTKTGEGGEGHKLLNSDRFFFTLGQPPKSRKHISFDCMALVGSIYCLLLCKSYSSIYKPCVCNFKPANQMITTI